MNILLSDVCNRKCSFCFAQDVHEHKGQKFIKKEDFFTAVDFARRSGQDEIRIIGGEPSLHPQFIEILEELSQLPVSIMLFTNGIMSKKKVDYLRDVLSKKTGLRFLCNVSKSEKDSAESLEKRDYFLMRLYKHIGLSVTIDKPLFEYEYVFDLIRKHLLKRVIRVGIAHPIHNVKNNFLELRYFKTFSVMYAILVREAAARGYSIFDDCGMPTCLTGYKDSICVPIIDVGVDLTVWPCFPLSTFERVPLSNFKNINEIEDHFKKVVQSRGVSRLFDHCTTCTYEPTCNGGCLAHRINL